MPQAEVWEKEYNKPRLVTGSDEPQNDFKRFVKWLRKVKKVDLEDLRVLDLGSGTGKNTIFLAERGAKVVGMEISDTALKITSERARNVGLLTNHNIPVIARSPRRSNPVESASGLPSPDQSVGARNDVSDAVGFLKANIGAAYPFSDQTFDLALDIMSSNSLNAAERKIYLKETHRVLKPGGYFFVRALALDSDKHASLLLKNYQGKEKGTYKIPEMGLIEKVFTREEFIKSYEKYFKILKLELKHGYSKFKGKTYKRNYWVGCLQK